DQFGSRVELFVGDPYRLCCDPAFDQDVGFPFDALGIEQAHVDIEIEATLVRCDVAAGDRCYYHTRHHMQGGMQAHQRVAALPVDFQRQRLADLELRCG